MFNKIGFTSHNGASPKIELNKAKIKGHAIGVIEMEIGKIDAFERGIKMLPSELRKAAIALPLKYTDKVEEIRLRTGRFPTVLVEGIEQAFNEDLRISENDLRQVLELATRSSIHSHVDSIRKGFVTADGGVRVGLCGTAVTDNGEITGMRNYSSICIRIPREKQGCAKDVFVKHYSKCIKSTLIISPPGGGKTTFLRDLVRMVSDSGKRVSVVDERSEIAGTFEGRTCFDVGRCTDVLTAAPKSEGMFLLLRAMSPQIIAFDEITEPKDIATAQFAANCGVSLFATAHAESLDDLQMRPMYKQLLDSKIFEKLIIISCKKGIRTYSVEDLP